MRFALLGDHPDGLDLARALVATGRHELAAYQPGSAAAAARAKEDPLAQKIVVDIEEILADPAIDGLIVAGHLDARPAQLRRALQSERLVVCVYPPDETADIAYEASMIQADTQHVLLPLQTAGLHPALRLLAERFRTERFNLLQVERRFIAPEARAAEQNVWLPDWELLRRLGGEIVEITAYAEKEEAGWTQPLLAAGSFEKGGLFQLTLLPGADTSWRLRVLGSQPAELIFEQGWPGPARLTWRDDSGEHEQAFAEWHGAAAFVEVVESAIAKTPRSDLPGWPDAIRCLELDDSLRRSVAKRRASLLDYQEASEEVGFKGTMTLVGCGLLWLVMFLAVMSAWFPKLGWLILPVLLVFLAMQLLRWVIPRRGE